FADRAARLHRIDDDPVVDEIEGNPMLRRGHRPLDRDTVAHLPIEAEVARRFFPYAGLVWIERAGGLDDSRERLILDCDQLGRIARRGGAFRDDHRARVTDMPYTVADDRRMWRQHRRRPVAVGDRAEARNVSDPVARDVIPGQDGEHAGGGKRCRRIDSADARMRVRRAQHEGISLVRSLNVIDIIAATGDEAPVLDAADRLTDAE